MEIRIPQLSESVTEGDIAAWLKEDGARVEKDEPILELETDKATVEIAAEASGTLEILKPAGEAVTVGDVVGRIVEGAAAEEPEPEEPEPEEPEPEEPQPEEPQPEEPQPEEPEPEKKPPPQPRPEEAPAEEPPGPPAGEAEEARKEPEPEPRVTREVVRPAEPQPAAVAPEEPGTRRVRMTRLRQRIAERLVEAQRTAAILTTFNEIDMTEVLALRKENQERFESQHGVRLGFMSLFARASILALREFGELNAYIEGDEIVYHDSVHLGIAVGTPRGLVVPVLRDADRMTFAEAERRIADLAKKARDGDLAIEDLQGGTFTISNGGIYGSLMSTPILNPPQSGILGMHKIERRPVVIEDRAGGVERILARPMMYVALSYDHRIVDGEQAVTFLVRIKERLEDPTRMLLDS